MSTDGMKALLIERGGRETLKDLLRPSRWEHLTAEEVSQIANRGVSDLERELLQHPNAPSEIRLRCALYLSEHDPKALNRRFLDGMEPEQVVALGEALFAHTGSFGVTAYVFHLPVEFYRRASTQDSDLECRTAAFKNWCYYATKPEDFELLKQDPTGPALLCKNDNCPPEVLTEIFKTCAYYAVKRHIVNRADCPQEVIDFALASETRHIRELGALALREEHLDQITSLVESETSYGVLHELLKKEFLPEDLLLKTYAKHPPHRDNLIQKVAPENVEGLLPWGDFSGEADRIFYEAMERSDLPVHVYERTLDERPELENQIYGAYIRRKSRETREEN